MVLGAVRRVVPLVFRSGVSRVWADDAAGVGSYEEGLGQIREIEKRRASRGYAVVA